jgi:hypothetical protein
MTGWQRLAETTRCRNRSCRSVIQPVEFGWITTEPDRRGRHHVYCCRCAVSRDAFPGSSDIELSARESALQSLTQHAIAV